MYGGCGKLSCIHCSYIYSSEFQISNGEHFLTGKFQFPLSTTESILIEMSHWSVLYNCASF